MIRRLQHCGTCTLWNLYARALFVLHSAFLKQGHEARSEIPHSGPITSPPFWRPPLCYFSKSADPSRRDMEISYAGSKRCRLILIQAQTPKSKIQTAPFGAAAKITKAKLIQNPKSKLQNPNSKLQNPNSKIQTARLEFGFWIWSGWGRRRWLCSKLKCMAALATRIWPSRRRASLQPKGSRLGPHHARPKLGTDFWRRGFAGN